MSVPRFQRYLEDCNGDEAEAIRLYQWNSLLSQSLYIYVQSWEICLRNKLNDFLVWRFGSDWPYDQTRAVRVMKGNDKRRLEETLARQEASRNACPVPTSVVVADLSAGFWVSLLSSSYDVPYAWRYNLQRIFSNDQALDRQAAWEICDNTLVLRNRIAHHEPIFHLPLESNYRDLQRIVIAMCPGTFAFANANCTFREVLSRRP